MDRDKLADFFEQLYAPADAGIGAVELRLISHIGDSPQRRFFTSTAGITEVSSRWSAKYRKAGVYFGVALRKPNTGAEKQTGKKADCACVTALWVDIDVKKENWDMQRTLGALKMSPLRPSLVVNSGNGYHCYWLLSEPISLMDLETAEAQIETIEAANGALAEMFGGDPSAKDVTRVLRVPYTINNKGEKPIDVKIEVADWGLEYTLVDILAATAFKKEALFDGEWLSKEAVKEKLKAKKDRANERRIARQYVSELGYADRSMGFEEIWRHTKYHVSGMGNAFMGIDEAILRSAAVLYARKGGEWTDEQIVDDILTQVRKVKERDAKHETWNWQQERREIQEKLERFKPRWAKMQEEAENGAKKRKSRTSAGKQRSPASTE